MFHSTRTALVEFIQADREIRKGRAVRSSDRTPLAALHQIVPCHEAEITGTSSHLRRPSASKPTPAAPS